MIIYLAILIVLFFLSGYYCSKWYESLPWKVRRKFNHMFSDNRDKRNLRDMSVGVNVTQSEAQARGGDQLTKDIAKPEPNNKAKLFFELEEKKKQEKKEREIDAKSSYQGGGIALLLFLIMLACSLYVFYITVTTPGCKDTGDKVMHVILFGALDVFLLMETYGWWMHLTYSPEKWAKVIDNAYKFNEEQKRKKRMKQLDKELRPKWYDGPSPGITD